MAIFHSYVKLPEGNLMALNPIEKNLFPIWMPNWDVCTLLCPVLDTVEISLACPGKKFPTVLEVWLSKKLRSSPAAIHEERKEEFSNGKMAPKAVQ